VKTSVLEHPWGIPASWCWVRAGEVAEIIGGGTPRTDVVEYWEEGDVPWVTPADLSNYREVRIGRGARFIGGRDLRSRGPDSFRLGRS